MLRNNLSNKTTTTDTLLGNLWKCQRTRLLVVVVVVNDKWRIKHLSCLYMYKLYLRIITDEGKSLIHSLINEWVICAMLSRVQLFTTPWTAAHQAPLSMGFSRQGYWSGVPLPVLGDLPDPGIEPASLMCPTLAGRFFATVPPGKLNEW